MSLKHGVVIAAGLLQMLICCSQCKPQVSTSALSDAKFNDSLSEGTLSFNEFTSKFKKEYANTTEEQKRHSIFQNTVSKIEDHNKLYVAGKSSYKMGLNQFSDITYEEFISMHTGGLIEDDDTIRNKRSTPKYYKPIDLGKEPSSKNYVDLKAVNPIRNQGSSCGSCWAFAAVSSIESQIFLKKGVLQQLSEQYLVDCDTTSLGCKGGYREKKFLYSIHNRLALASNYSYTGKNDQSCRQNTQKTRFNIASRQFIRQQQNEQLQDHELLNALVHIGPIAVSIHTSENFKDYGSEVIDDKLCNSNSKTTHQVLVVGYGKDNGHDYWLIRNSHGESWGEEGYMRLSRRHVNQCRISSYAIFPVLEDIDECLDNKGGCIQTCTNTVGSFTCSCTDGYTLNNDDKSCTDIDECLDNKGGCIQTCTNNVGSFTCSCTDGYTLNNDDKSCTGTGCLEDEGFFTTRASSQCFKLYQQPSRTWEEAKAWCASEGMVLAKPEDGDLQEFRKQLLDAFCPNKNQCSTFYVWIGGRRSGSSFIWDRDGSVLREKVSSDEPDSNVGMDFCLSMHPGMKQSYFSRNCSLESFTLCEGNSEVISA